MSFGWVVSYSSMYSSTNHFRKRFRSEIATERIIALAYRHIVTTPYVYTFYIIEQYLSWGQREINWAESRTESLTIKLEYKFDVYLPKCLFYV